MNGLNNRNIFSHSPGGCKFGSWCQPGPVLVRASFLIHRQQPHYILTWQKEREVSSFLLLFCVCVWVCVFNFYNFFNFCHTMQISYNYTYIPFLMSLPPLPPSLPSKSSQTGLPVLHGNFSPPIHPTPHSVYMSRILCPFVPLSFSYPVSTSPFSTSVSPFLP